MVLKMLLEEQDEEDEETILGLDSESETSGLHSLCIKVLIASKYVCVCEIDIMNNNHNT